MTAALLLLAALALVVACGIFVAAEFAFLAVDRPDRSNGWPRAATAARRARSPRCGTCRPSCRPCRSASRSPTWRSACCPNPRWPPCSRARSPLSGSPRTPCRASPIAIALIVSTLLTMLLGELVPKNLAIALPVQVASWVQAPVRPFTRSIAWPIRWLNGLANAILHRFGMEAQEELASARSAEELLAVVRRSAQEGSLEGDTATLLARSLVFGTRRAQDAMTPRVRMHTVAATRCRLGRDRHGGRDRPLALPGHRRERRRHRRDRARQAGAGGAARRARMRRRWPR